MASSCGQVPRIVEQASRKAISEQQLPLKVLFKLLDMVVGCGTGFFSNQQVLVWKSVKYRTKLLHQ